MLAATCAPDPCKNSVPPPSAAVCPKALAKVGLAMFLMADSSATLAAGLKYWATLASGPRTPPIAPVPNPKPRLGVFLRLYSAAC